MTYLSELYEKKNYLNGIFLVLQRIFGPATFLIFTPIFISKLGLEQFGIWVLLFTITNLTRLVTFGTTSSFTHFIAKSKLVDEKKTYIANIFIILILLYIFLFCLVSFLLFLANQIEIITELQNFKIINELIIFSLTLTLINIYQENLYSIMYGLEKFFFPSIMSLFSKLLLLSVQVMLILTGSVIKEIIILSILTLLLNAIFETVLINIYYINFIKKFFQKINFQKIKKIFGYSKYLGLSAFISILNANIDRLFVSYLFGPISLSYYSIALSIFQLIHTIYGSFFLWVIPKLSSSKYIDKKKLFINLNMLVLFLGAIGLFLIKLISPYFLNFWLGENSNSDLISYINLFLISNFLFLFTIIIHNYFISFEYTKQLFIFNLLNFFLFVTFMIFLQHFFKIEGIIIARLIVIIPIIYGINKMFNKFNFLKN